MERGSFGLPVLPINHPVRGDADHGSIKPGRPVLPEMIQEIKNGSGKSRGLYAGFAGPHKDLRETRLPICRFRKEIVRSIESQLIGQQSRESALALGEIKNGGVQK